MFGTSISLGSYDWLLNVVEIRLLGGSQFSFLDSETITEEKRSRLYRAGEKYYIITIADRMIVNTLAKQFH